MVADTDGRRRRHSAAERRAVMGRFAACSTTIAEFCESESISVATLRRWQAECGSDVVQRDAVPRGFVDLGALGGGGALTIEMDLGGGVVLRVRRGG